MLLEKKQENELAYAISEAIALENGRSIFDKDHMIDTAVRLSGYDKEKVLMVYEKRMEMAI